MAQIRTSSLAARRQAFRNSIIADTQANIFSILGNLKPGRRIVDVAFALGAQGTALNVDDHAFLRLGLNGLATILTWSMAGTVAGASSAGTIALDILVGSTLATAATICGVHPPTLTATAELADQVPAVDWTVQLTDPSWVLIKVASTGGTLEVVGLTLRCAVDSR